MYLKNTKIFFASLISFQAEKYILKYCSKPSSILIFLQVYRYLSPNGKLGIKWNQLDENLEGKGRSSCFSLIFKFALNIVHKESYDRLE